MLGKSGRVVGGCGRGCASELFLTKKALTQAGPARVSYRATLDVPVSTYSYREILMNRKSAELIHSPPSLDHNPP